MDSEEQVSRDRLGLTVRKVLRPATALLHVLEVDVEEVSEKSDSSVGSDIDALHERDHVGDHELDVDARPDLQLPPQENLRPRDKIPVN